MSTKQLHMFRGMRAVEADYAASGMTDTEFANSISDGTAEGNYSCAQIRQYRQNLGIANNVATTRVTAAQVAELRRLLALACSALFEEDATVDRDALTNDASDILEATK